ncbi:acetylglutamate kinase [Halovenus sp. WSH3]|uniref:Isopentenyl phosphate kinase n=1 Tax=Halovenus carboxidivorans TaxID=2692199 RepID=A0A6B0T9V1_9EURY|nr:isopentenyl phosphate kinase [Halovenus carboxidivorans]MXR52353.1 acetylglutamate kinase [Halovenus carboxidivorans]
MTTILKLGGSVITDKDEPETVDDEQLGRAAEAIAGYVDSGGEIVVVHGGGSFGHHHAAAHGVTRADGSHDGEGLLAIHRAMGRLTDAVLDALADRGVDPLPVRPLSAGFRGEDGTVTLADGSVRTMLAEGFVPVLNGDVIAHAGHGGTIVSGDTLVVSLAESLDADRVGLCSTVPGVLDDDGAVIDEIRSFEAVADVLGESESTDVTGGMAAKVQRLLELDTPASVFDPDGLSEFLDTGRAGTVVR